MSILDTVARRLSANEYSVVFAADELRFEDASVLGFVAEFQTVRDLLEGWQAEQERFLRSNAAALRRDRRKAWNVYSILLTREQASEEQSRALVAVEEDFGSTRKVARAGVITDRDIERALGVLLPIRHRVSLSSENALGVLARRLDSLPSRAVEVLLAGGSAEEFVEALIQVEEAG
jgi:hypothetical protein